MFWFRLASHLGMSVRRAQQEIDSREFTQWLALYLYWGLDVTGWEQAGMMCAVTAGIHGAKCTPEDFMPKKKLPQTPQQMIHQMMLSVMAVNGGEA